MQQRIINIGISWISHGNNKVTFATPFPNTNYSWNVALASSDIGEVTSRNVPHTSELSINTKNVSSSFAIVRIDGGYMYSACGAGPVSANDRFDDVSNSWLAVTSFSTANSGPAGFSISGYGFISRGYDSLNYTNVQERFDAAANVVVSRMVSDDRGQGPEAASVGGYGFISSGYNGSYSTVVNRFDDTADINTLMQAYPYGHYIGTAYSIDGYYFVSCGDNGNGGTTNRMDIVGSFWIARKSATPRQGSVGFSMNGYGFVSMGRWSSTDTAIVERFDDYTNAYTSRTNVNEARYWGTGGALGGFGFTNRGTNGNGTHDRLDDVANTQTARTIQLSTVSHAGAGFTTNEYFIQYFTVEDK